MIDPQDYPKLLEAFLADAQAAGRRPQGLRGARFRVPWLFRYLAETGASLEAVRVREAAGYSGWLGARRTRAGRPPAAATVCPYLKAASAFYEWLLARGVVAANPFRAIRRPRPEQRLPAGVYTEAQMQSLLERLAAGSAEGSLKRRIRAYRVYLVAELQYATGLRIAEVAALSTADLDLERGTVTVRAGKGGRSRIAWMHTTMGELLRDYLGRMRTLLANEWNERHGSSLFGHTPESLARMVNTVLREACREAGLPPIRSHGFRHALGYHLHRAGCPIRVIQQILGHTCLRHTEVYVKVDASRLRAELDTFHPRSRPPR